MELNWVSLNLSVSKLMVATKTWSGQTLDREMETRKNRKYSGRPREDCLSSPQKVTIPPHSKTTLIAFSKPIQGEIPFTAIYELFPTGSKKTNSARILEKILRHYGMDQKMEKTRRGTLLVHYKGTIHLDFGHEIDVDIQSVKLGKAPPKLFLLELSCARSLKRWKWNQCQVCCYFYLNPVKLILCNVSS